MRLVRLLLIPIAASLLGACHTDQGSTPEIRSGVVTLRGNPVTLEGEGVRVGQPAPDFTAVANDMSERSLSDYRGRVVILTSVPSLDTAVCSTETHTFNERASALGEDVAVLTVSMDLPFAQKRWCGANGVERVQTLSDYMHRSFAEAFGLRIRESGLLARTVYVIDGSGIIRYEQIVPELTTEPDYDAALAAARDAR
jgi:thiol peroxidase